LSVPRPRLRWPYGTTLRQEAQETGYEINDCERGQRVAQDQDGAPLSLKELHQGLYDVGHRLKPHGDCRFKYVTLYITAVDRNGEEVVLDPKGEWTLYPYESAADEHGV
jgi:hypothetical protein